MSMLSDVIKKSEKEVNRKELYALFDKKIGNYSGVKDYQNVVEMTRDFEVIVRNMDKRYYMANHLDEFCVCRIGFFNIKTGEITACNPVSVLELCTFNVVNNEGKKE